MSADLKAARDLQAARDLLANFSGLELDLIYKEVAGSGYVARLPRHSDAALRNRILETVFDKSPTMGAAVEVLYAYIARLIYPYMFILNGYDDAVLDTTPNLDYIDAPKPHKKCVCDIHLLMRSGCQCGSFVREKEAAELPTKPHVDDEDPWANCPF